MSMKLWIEQRSAALLAELNAIPYSDDHDIKKQMLIRKALRDSLTELMRRSSERTLSDMVSEAAMAEDPLAKK